MEETTFAFLVRPAFIENAGLLELLPPFLRFFIPLDSRTEVPVVLCVYSNNTNT